MTNKAVLDWGTGSKTCPNISACMQGMTKWKYVRWELAANYMRFQNRMICDG
ncbi:MAG: hypothetical protein K2O03_03150 [Lachnospiraceae bacterium]|nr:hypothetical protein [Lachnospiraceae bacterium]